MTGAELKALRKSIGISVDEAAAQVFVKSRTWERYEANKKPIPGGVVELFRMKNHQQLSAIETPPIDAAIHADSWLSKEKL